MKNQFSIPDGVFDENGEVPEFHKGDLIMIDGLGNRRRRSAVISEWVHGDGKTTISYIPEPEPEDTES